MPSGTGEAGVVGLAEGKKLLLLCSDDTDCLHGRPNGPANSWREEEADMR